MAKDLKNKEDIQKNAETASRSSPSTYKNNHDREGLPPGRIELTMTEGLPMLVPVSDIGLVYPKKKGGGCIIEVYGEGKIMEVKESYDDVVERMYEAR